MSPPKQGAIPHPMSVPAKNHPIAVPRSDWRYISLMQELPTVRRAVPSKAVRRRKMKNEARLGDKAVPIEQPKKRARVMRQI